MAKNLNIQTAKGAINTILNLDYIDQCKALGINESEWNDLTGPKPWSGKQRPVIKRLCYSCHFLSCLPCNIRFIHNLALPVNFYFIHIFQISYQNAYTSLHQLKSVPQFSNTSTFQHPVEVSVFYQCFFYITYIHNIPIHEVWSLTYISLLQIPRINLM